MSMRQRGVVRWGIVGCGDVTEVKSGPGFQKAERSKLVAVMRRQGALAADFARRHNVPRFYDDADALINDPEVDAVYVATPPGSHLELALKVCAAGKPAYVEKPMARSHSECEQMVTAFRQAGVPLFVAYYRRQLPRFLKVRDLLADGRLGNVSAVICRQSMRPLDIERNARLWRVDPTHSGGGLLLDMGAHALDIIDFLFGPMTDVSGCAANAGQIYAAEDTVAISFLTGSGVIGSGLWNYASAFDEDLLEITGTGGRLSLSVFGDTPITLSSPEGTEQFDVLNPPHVHQPLIQSIVNELLGSGTCPSTGETAARTSKVMDVALDKFYRGRSDAFWERELSSRQ